MEFRLNPSLDEVAIAGALASTGRVQICDFLTEDSAEALLRSLLDSEEWQHVLNAGDKVYEIPCSRLGEMDEQQRRTLDLKADQEAAFGFQFRFDTIRVPDGPAERAGRQDLLAKFATFLSSPEVLGWFRRVTDCDAIDFADAQATRYRPRSFLTSHDDAVEGKRRHFAYVLNLTKDWRPEWGGLLFFPDDLSRRVDCLVPHFNLLNLFAVGQQHGVSQVASYSPRQRVSVTGWLRSFDS